MVKQGPQEPRLIPTLARAATSRGSSFPLGAEAISEALHDVPQFGKLSISFDAQPPASPLDPACIVFAGVGCRSRDEWAIWVSAVPSDLAARARSFALEHGLPHLRAWLLRPRSDTWYLHWHRCAMAVDPITNEGILAELEEQRLLEQLPPVHLRAPESAPSRPRR